MNNFDSYYDPPDDAPYLRAVQPDIFQFSAVDLPKPGEDPVTLTLRIGEVEIPIEVAPPGHYRDSPDHYRIAIYDGDNHDHIEAMWWFAPPPPTPSIEGLYAHLGEEQP